MNLSFIYYHFVCFSPLLPFYPWYSFHVALVLFSWYFCKIYFSLIVLLLSLFIKIPWLKLDIVTIVFQNTLISICVFSLFWLLFSFNLHNHNIVPLIFIFLCYHNKFLDSSFTTQFYACFCVTCLFLLPIFTIVSFYISLLSQFLPW